MANTADVLKCVEDSHTSGLYRKRGPVIVSGRDALLQDIEGRQYIDCVAGHGAAAVGHSNAMVAEAVSRQAARLITCPESFYNDKRAEFLGILAGTLPEGLRRFFLCNSGTEAVEAAIKFARVATGRQQIVAAKRGFHGRSLGALSATWEPKYKEPFVPLVPGFKHVTYNDLDSMREAVSEQTAAVLLEPVQGEGGVHVADNDYLHGVQQICQEAGALLVLDEIQTGSGRTGKMFAFEHSDVIPDMICLAKAVAGGVPMGVVAVGERLGTLPKGVHASTFGGNPLACAAGCAALTYIIEENLPKRAHDLGLHFFDRLRAIHSPLVREVRGKGLMVGVEIKAKNARYLEALLDRGVLALSAGSTVIRFLPPLVIQKQQLDFVADQLEKVLCT